MPDKLLMRFRVNGEPQEVAVRVEKTLLEVLREDLGLTGTKHGCELGECGMCAVAIGGRPILSCLALAVECQDQEITTVEGLAKDGRLDPLQETFAALGAAQCGYCTPAFLVTARALLDRDPHPSRKTIAKALSGALCRCTGYLKIFEAVEEAMLKATAPGAAHASPPPASTPGAPAPSTAPSPAPGGSPA
ncbi:MAG: 2Fe-2S iron-sulfur cluster binding domain-containing protein [Planctomycetes bacterium]|nr:2Fe-2S iron-sulfur cluster binding domain-containing protein [Planctomycetota bacterium]